MRIVGVNHLRPELADDPRKAERGGEIQLVGRRQPDEIVPLGRAARQLAVRVRDEHRAVPPRAQAEDGQEDLVLSPAPRAGSVDVEAEHLNSNQ